MALSFSPVLLMTEKISLQFWGLLVFCVGKTFMFFSSTMYHLVSEELLKFKLRVTDHISIFVLIGASYTPFVLFYYNTPEGIKFLIFQWSIIFAGIVFKLIFKTKYEVFSLILYTVLGWMVVFIYQPITAMMPNIVENWMIAGGVCYTVGIVFYVWKTIWHHHAIWHIFVILGVMCHFIALSLS